MAATFDRLSGGRLLINVVTGGDPAELAGDGLFVSHDERYEITDEFLRIWRGILERSHTGGSLDFAGKHLRSSEGRGFSRLSEALSAAVLRGLLAGGDRTGRGAGRCLSDLG